MTGRKSVWFLATVTVIIFCVNRSLWAETPPEPEWTWCHNGDGSDVDQPVALRLDKSNNVIVAGTAFTAPWPGQQEDICVVKYNSLGDRLWVRLWDNGDLEGANRDFAYDAAVDNNGNVYVTGYSWGGWDTYGNWVTIKYNSAGAQQWTRWFTGKGGKRYDTPVAMVVDKNNNIYITGYCDGNDPNYSDYATVKYDPNGNMQWQNWYEGPALKEDYAAAITTDSNFVYVTGTSERGPTAADIDCATIKYRCDNGTQLWAKRYNNASGNSTATGIAVDKNGNVYISGKTDTGPSGTTDSLVVKYTSAGVESWHKIYNGPGNSIDEAEAIAVDSAGHVYATGDSVNYLRGFPNATYRDLLTVRYDPNNGNLVWINAYDVNDPNRSNIADTGYAITMGAGADANVYVTGVSEVNYVTIKYDPADGSRRWVQNYTYPSVSGYDGACAIAVDANSNVYVTGSSYGGAAADYDFATIKYSQDRDGDGLPDTWETKGIDYDQDGTVDLVLPGADPDHKDLFVEVDGMTGRAPAAATLDAVVAAFDDVPNELVDNPDEDDGITLHIELDETAIPLAIWNTWIDTNGDGQIDWIQEFDIVKTQRFGTPTQRANPNWSKIKGAKRKAYRYCVFANRLGTTTISGIAELPGNDFVVTLGGWPTQGGTAEQQQGTFMHEMGHTLNLRHGGADDISFKPNYHSIMNYTWQAPAYLAGVVTGNRQAYRDSWALDYSRDVFPTLDETALNETTGIGGHVGHVVPIGPVDVNARLVTENGPVNWNDDNDINDVNVVSDITWVSRSYPRSSGQILVGYCDWPNVKYYFRGLPEFQDGVHVNVAEPNEEMTFEIHMELSRIGCAPGDIDCDGKVDLSDFAILADQWLESSGHYPSADIAPDGGDGTVDFIDLTLLVEHWLEGTSP